MVDDMHFAYPDAPEGAFFPHWVVYNLPPDSTGLTEGQSAELSLPEGRGLQGLNGYPEPHDQGYGGPCPGPGEKHLYIFTLYALDTSPGLPPGAQYEAVLQALEGHILEQAELKGYYMGM
jgi:Raf kinase inhibitor-like YbhB/YbcL family protein